MTDSSNEESTPWTIARLLAWATDDLRKRGLESPRLEAELLLTSVLQVDRMRLIMDAQRPLGERELGAYRALFQRRRKGEPISYILGTREFYGHAFMVTPSVLIPRPDTETLVEVALQRTAHRNLSGRALDLCTGSGCVAISYALERPTWKVTGTDLSEKALAVARKNALHLGALWGVRFASGNLFGAVSKEEKFELITCNPPYIASQEVLTLEANVKDFEPHEALDGGETGLDFYPLVAQGASKHLVPGGILALELGAGQASDVEKILADHGFTDLERKRDFGGHERVVSGKAPRGSIPQ